MTHTEFKEWFIENGFEIIDGIFSDFIRMPNGADIDLTGEEYVEIGKYIQYPYEHIIHLTKTDNTLTFHFTDKSEYKVVL